MITPRQTRLLRARDLQSFQHGIAEAIGASSATSAGCAVLVPSRAAAEQLHRTLRRLPGRAVIVPLLLTRQDWYRRMHERLPAVPPMLSAADRELLLTEAAEQRHLMREQLTAGSTHLSEWCDEVVDVGSLMHCLGVGIRDTLNIEFTRSELSRPERDHADAIAAAAEAGCRG